jgi:hypothetical protein
MYNQDAVMAGMEEKQLEKERERKMLWSQY